MLMLGFLGTPEIVIIVVAVLLIFGPSKLPALARAVGQSIREFKSSSSEPIDHDKDDRGGSPPEAKK